jgi:hypothetical protein
MMLYHKLKALKAPRAGQTFQTQCESLQINNMGVGNKI